MTSVAFSRTPVTLGTGVQGKITSAADHNRSAALEGTNGDAPSRNPGSGKAPFRHINDLVSVNVDIDPHTPLRKILEIGDTHMRQAITYNDFRRPDLALQEYIKAFTIAVDKVPRHKDYPSIKSDRGDLVRLYNSLKTNITTHGTTFDKIKEDIKEDNRRSGVQPTTSSARQSEPLLRSHDDYATGPQVAGLQVKVENSSQDKIASGAKENASTGVKPKPAVMPKPQALHGKTIRKTTQAVPEDLADRFARLRASGGPGGLDKSFDKSQLVPSVDKSATAMPELPKAIYNPARGTVTSEIANLPSSNPRGLFSRTNSIVSVSSCSSQVSPANVLNTTTEERFAAAHTYRPLQPSIMPNGASIPEGDTITAKALANLIEQRSLMMNILVIDVRSREAFDEGHIKSYQTICVEPEILTRENISADEIADSMVLAPPNERLAFEQRDKADLVVIYDEHSTTVPAKISGDFLEMILYNLRQALSYYSYSRPLKGSPKLLTGGLGSWVDEFGELSLETSNTSDPTLRGGEGQRPRAKTRLLNQDEIDHFEGIVREDQAGSPAFDYIKTREDFIRRFPSVSGAAESMTSPIQEQYPGFEGNPGAQGAGFLASMTPAPPTRPAPAMPRTRYSGMESQDDDVNAGGFAMRALSGHSGAVGRTGLDNPLGTTCYANSTIQALFASPGFVEGMLDTQWPQMVRPTRPQLMSKILKNLFTWMEKRQFASLTPTTLLDYCHSIHQGSVVLINGREVTLRLGDRQQQDMDEMISFMLGEIAAETDRTAMLPPRPRSLLPDGTDDDVVRIVNSFWHIMYSHRQFNFVDDHFGVVAMSSRTCNACRHIWTVPDTQRTLTIPLPASDTQLVNIQDTLARDFGTSSPLTVECPECKHGHATKSTRLIKLPRLLRIHCQRTRIVRSNQVKAGYPLDLPDELNLRRLVYGGRIRRAASDLIGKDHNDGVASTTKYDLYAVTVHQGPNASSGHYITYVVNPDGGYVTECNDSRCSTQAASQALDALRRFRHGGWTVTSAFYKRQDIPFRAT
ncbi:cysteine proteinase [Hypomontagnella monticulosa]|nr:cysteine proteinase [Hypomontagnella monticulosa]